MFLGVCIFVLSKTSIMFTVEQIRHAHSRVKSGADFPDYIQDLIKLGVVSYETFVSDGHTDYYGRDGYKTASAARYEPLVVAEFPNAGSFKADLAAHQQGKTDYPAFCRDAAREGVEKWVVVMDRMTCTYYDKAGKEMLEERIPG
jgi:uncharacterized protein YbcV (DUF1398 family)